MVANCLQALYLRLHGPEADYSTLVTRDELIALLLPVITGSPVLEPDGTESEEDTGEDERVRLNAIIRQLIDNGWIETLADKSQLVSVYRLTRAGKVFTRISGEGFREAVHRLLEYLRRYPPGARIPGVEDDGLPAEGLRQRLNQREAATLMVLRFLYDQKLGEGQVDDDQEAAVAR